MRPLRYPQPHRHPAFKNVPIFERLHSADPARFVPQSPLKIGTFSVGGGRCGGSGVRGEDAFARNASPRTTSLVTFLFGHKKVTSPIGSINPNLTYSASNRAAMSDTGKLKHPGLHRPETEKPTAAAVGFSHGLERREVEKRIYNKGKRLTASAALHVYRLTCNFECIISVL